MDNLSGVGVFVYVFKRVLGYLAVNEDILKFLLVSKKVKKNIEKYVFRFFLVNDL